MSLRYPITLAALHRMDGDVIHYATEATIVRVLHGFGIKDYSRVDDEWGCLYEAVLRDLTGPHSAHALRDAARAVGIHVHVGEPFNVDVRVNLSGLTSAELDEVNKRLREGGDLYEVAAHVDELHRARHLALAGA